MSLVDHEYRAESVQAPSVVMKAATPIMRLAGRLAAAWETFRDHDKNGKGATTQADRDFSRRSSPGGLHDKIFELQPETLEEAMVALAVASDKLNMLAEDADTTCRAVAETVSRTIALAEAAGVAVHPACRAYFIRCAAPEGVA